MYNFLGKGDDFMSCKCYVGVHCVNGLCPRIIWAEYEDAFASDINCEDCWFNKGCEDCALLGTEYCEKG